MSNRAIVLVEPEIPENTGFIARLATNFDFELRIIEPCFNLSEARDTAKNCQDKLRNARIYEDLSEGVNDLDYIVGTKPGRGKTLKNFQPRENSSLMIGRESNGLKNEELKLCDSVVHIQTGEYSSINQSHAAGILMHSINSKAEKNGIQRSQKEILQTELPDPLYKTLLDSNPSKEQVGRILEVLKDR